MTTDDDERTESPPDAPRAARGSAIAGVLTAMLVIMGVGLLVAQIVSAANGQPGPGAVAVGSHLAGAAVGIGCYRVTVRRRGWSRVAALSVLSVVTVVLLALFWLAPS